MKVKIISAFTALLIGVLGIPLLSGCSASTAYTLMEDGDGNKYYVASCSGYKNSLYGELVIPSSYGEGENKAPVTEIAMQGFAGTNITKVTIPATVTKIGNAAFSYCNNLKQVVFEDGIKLDEISRGCFGYCPSLTSVDIPDGVKSIGMLAFVECLQLTYAPLPEGLESIGLKAFYSACSLESIIIPDSVTEIGIAAFHSCTSLKLAVVGGGISEIKSGVFGYCPALEQVYLPLSLKKVEGAHYTDGSEELEFDEGLFYCGHAFHDDTALTDVYYGGTASDWTALKAGIDLTPVNESGAILDNSALINATLHYEAKYGN